MNGTLIILPAGFEEIEAITPIDLLRRANIRLTVAALKHPQQVTGRSRLEIIADGMLDEYINNQYDMVILPGGPGHTNYFDNPMLEKFLKAQKGYMAAICAAPVALHRMGMLKGKRYTCFPANRDELKEALDERVVVDGKLITSVGAGSSYEFALKLIELLEGKERAEEVARQTCYLAKLA
jgi:4-methyl-5(b-hydroxyethyl)-thiazole monophosphate biosynthesis